MTAIVQSEARATEKIELDCEFDCCCAIYETNILVCLEYVMWVRPEITDRDQLFLRNFVQSM